MYFHLSQVRVRPERKTLSISHNLWQKGSVHCRNCNCEIILFCINPPSYTDYNIANGVGMYQEAERTALVHQIHKSLRFIFIRLQIAEPIRPEGYSSCIQVTLLLQLTWVRWARRKHKLTSHKELIKIITSLSLIRHCTVLYFTVLYCTEQRQREVQVHSVVSSDIHKVRGRRITTRVQWCSIISSLS